MGNVQVECTKTDVYWVHCQTCGTDGPRTEDVIKVEQWRAGHHRAHQAGGAVFYECPLPDCGWTHGEFPPAPGNLEPMAATFDRATVMLARQFARGAEQGIRAHLETHELVEWVQEVSRLRAEVGGLRGVADAAAKWAAFVDAAAAMSYVLDAGELERREREAGQALRDAVAETPGLRARVNVPEALR